MVWDRTNAESATFEDITVSPVEFGGFFLWCLKDLKVFKCYFLTPYWRRAFKAMVATFDSKGLLALLTRTFTVNKPWYRLCTAISILAIGQFRKSFGHFFYIKSDAPFSFFFANKFGGFFMMLSWTLRILHRRRRLGSSSACYNLNYINSSTSPKFWQLGDLVTVSKFSWVLSRVFKVVTR